MHWDDAARTLTLAARDGSFPGMLAKRTFHVDVVGKGHGVGIAEGAAVTTVTYKGESSPSVPEASLTKQKGRGLSRALSVHLVRIE